MGFYEQIGKRAALFDGSAAPGGGGKANSNPLPPGPGAPNKIAPPTGLNTKGLTAPKLNTASKLNTPTVTAAPSPVTAPPPRPAPAAPAPTQPTPPLATPQTSPTTTAGGANSSGTFGNFMNPATLMSLPGVGNILQSVLGSSPFGLIGLSALQDMSTGQNRLKTLTQGPQTQAGGLNVPIT